jgi:hypothetical protein
VVFNQKLSTTLKGAKNIGKTDCFGVSMEEINKQAL